LASSAFFIGQGLEAFSLLQAASILARKSFATALKSEWVTISLGLGFASVLSPGYLKILYPSFAPVVKDFMLLPQMLVSPFSVIAFLGACNLSDASRQKVTLCL
jgi:hypothetical protein